MILKKFAAVLSAVFILCYIFCTSSIKINAQSENIILNARHAALIDSTSKRVLYGKNENTKAAMASTTKIMTCLVALKYGNFNAPCTCSAYASSMPQVHLCASKGEAFDLSDLLYSLMLKSQNDSAVIIAENTAYNYIYQVKNSLRTDDMQLIGDTDFSFLNINNEYNSSILSQLNSDQSKILVHIFAGIMNETAKSFGCYDTYFITPNGLDASDENGTHSTNAKDLAVIMSYCIDNTDFLKITQSDNHTFSSYKITDGNKFTPSGKSYSVNNTNALLHMYDNIISGKTGFTCDAGYCYVCAYRSENRTFVVALLACGWPPAKTYKYKDAKVLLDYARSRYFYKDVICTRTAIKPVTVTNGKTDHTDVYIIENFGLLLSDSDQVNVIFNIPSYLEAPVVKDSVAGHISIYINDVLVKEIPAYTASDVNKLEYNDFITDVIKKFIFSL